MDKLSVKTKVLYGMGGVGDAASYNFIENYALFFLTTIAGVNPAIAGTIVAIGSVWETVSGAIVGYASDGLQSRFGKRKPFLITAAVPLGVCLSLLFTAIDASAAVKTIYYAAIMIVYTSSFSAFYVPYLTWGSEITQNYDERSKIRGYVQAFSSIGMVIGQAVPMIAIDFLIRLGENAAQSWQTLAIFCGTCAAGCILVTGIFTKDKYAHAKASKPASSEEISAAAQDGAFAKASEREDRETSETRVGMLRAYIRALSFRPVNLVFWGSAFYLIGYAVFCADRVYYFTYNMGLSAGKISLIMFYMAVTSVVFIPLVVYGVKLLDKRKAYITGMAISVVSMVFYGIIGIDSGIDVFLFITGYSFGSVVYWQLMPALIYDVCEADQLINREDRAGLLISLQTLAESIANAGGLQLLGLILSLAGFNGEVAVQSAKALQWTGISVSFIPALFMAASMYMIILYPISKDVYEKTVSALKMRENGEEPDMAEFEKIYKAKAR